jgi:hypothetical protein
MFVDGEWRHGTGMPLTVINPHTGLPLARVSGASAAEVDAAAEAAQAALPAWRSTSATNRGAFLERIAYMIENRASKLVELQMRSNGKPRFEADLDVVDAAATFRYYAGQCAEGKLRTPDRIELPGDVFEGMVRYEAVGVCAHRAVEFSDGYDRMETGARARGGLHGCHQAIRTHAARRTRASENRRGRAGAERRRQSASCSGSTAACRRC